MKKCIENYNEEELVKLMPDIPQETIHIVYGYYHRGKSISVYRYCDKCCISKSTLYRYIKKVYLNFLKKAR